MRLKVNNVRVSLLEETSVKEAAAKKLGLKKQDIDNLQIVRRAASSSASARQTKARRSIFFMAFLLFRAEGPL